MRAALFVRRLGMVRFDSGISEPKCLMSQLRCRELLQSTIYKHGWIGEFFEASIDSETCVAHWQAGNRMDWQMAVSALF